MAAARPSLKAAVPGGRPAGNPWQSSAGPRGSAGAFSPAAALAPAETGPRAARPKFIPRTLWNTQGESARFAVAEDAEGTPEGLGRGSRSDTGASPSQGGANPRWQCPACDGLGWISADPAGPDFWSSAVPCYDCGGTGWLTPSDFEALALRLGAE